MPWALVGIWEAGILCPLPLPGAYSGVCHVLEVHGQPEGLGGLRGVPGAPVPSLPLPRGLLALPLSGPLHPLVYRSLLTTVITVQS